jgi:hypothetical protein
MSHLVQTLRDRFSPVSALPAGMHRFQSPADAAHPFRLHLRLEADGSGVLIINARTVLHLNATAAEYAYHWIQNATPDQAARAVSSRYRVPRHQALADYQQFTDTVINLAQTQDLDPETFLGVERFNPYSRDLTAPYRLDCALTYQLPGGDKGHYAPIERVKAELTTDEWKTILDKAWAVGIPHVIFTGGEATLREDLPALIAHAEAIGQVSGLLSGSDRLADPAYLNTLLQSGLDHLMLLLRPDSDRSWQALQASMEANLFITVHLSLDKSQIGSLRQLFERLAKLQVRSLSLSSCDASGRAGLSKAVDLAAELGLPLAWDLPLPYSMFHPADQEEQKPASTGAGKGWLYLEPNGDVLPEQGIHKVLGNLLRDPWETIWKNAQSG